MTDKETIANWYHTFYESYKTSTCKKCGHVGLVDIGSCDKGCCDKWQCPQCKHSFLVELG